MLLGQEVTADPLTPGLYVVATPIGNLQDITLRSLATLAAADLIACEDTRVTRKLLNRYGINVPLIAYHDHNAVAAGERILAAVAGGAAVALASDAGTPLISDPGYRLVQTARAAGHAVTTTPGPSAVMAALSIAGLPTDCFCFDGFLPPKSAARQRRLGELARIPATLVFFETGPRLAASLADMAQALGPREAAVCRELTKLHEEVRRGDLATLANAYAQEAEPRGEVVVVVGPPPAEEKPDAAAIDDLLRAALARASLKDAVAEVTSISGAARADVYRRALTIKDQGDGASAEG